MQEEAIHKLVDERTLVPLSRPIVDGDNHTMYGHEALTTTD